MNQCSRNAARTFANLSSVEMIKTSAVESIHVGTADQNVMTSKETECKVHVVSNIHLNILQLVICSNINNFGPDVCMNKILIKGYLFEHMLRFPQLLFLVQGKLFHYLDHLKQNFYIATFDIDTNDLNPENDA